MSGLEKEGLYRSGSYEPWTASNILDAADSEVGPGCTDESYQKLRDIMEAGPDLLEALIEARNQLEKYELADSGEDYNSPLINAAIAKARGES